MYFITVPIGSQVCVRILRFENRCINLSANTVHCSLWLFSRIFSEACAYGYQYLVFLCVTNVQTRAKSVFKKNVGNRHIVILSSGRHKPGLEYPERRGAATTCAENAFHILIVAGKNEYRFASTVDVGRWYLSWGELLACTSLVFG